MEQEESIYGVRILYGTLNKFINVTGECIEYMQEKENLIIIPIGDNARAKRFGDPVPHVIKYIFVSVLNKPFETYSSTTLVRINIATKEVTTASIQDLTRSVVEIQSTLTLKHGNFMDEFPEQRIAVHYLTGNEKVLELGANIGRNTLIIARILAKKGNNNLVTMECDSKTVELLHENRNINGCTFQIEPSALSTRKLVQVGWSTIEVHQATEVPLVPTITLDELRQKYPITFDTLIVDCEGSFLSILQDMPNILHNIQLIIMENDYTSLEKKFDVNRILKSNGFYRDYIEEGGWAPCDHFFYEAWKRV